MAVALPDADSLLQDLNALRSIGKRIVSDIKIQRLKKQIEVYKSSDPSAYYIYLASLQCLTGEIDEAKTSGEKGLRLSNPAIRTLYHVTTLMYSGLYTDARELSARLKDSELLDSDKSVDARSVNLLVFCQSYSRVESLLKSNQHNLNQLLTFTQSVNRIIADYGIDEQSILSMLDIAGEVLHCHHLIQSNDLRILPYPSDGTVNISIPINVSPDQVAKLEWEYCEQLFTKMPDAPAKFIHVGFCCN